MTNTSPSQTAALLSQDTTLPTQATTLSTQATTLPTQATTLPAETAPLPDHLKNPSKFQQLKTRITHHLNFYRVHLLTFTLVPLILSAVFYAGNTSTHVPYIDCLFLCVTAMCVTGLSTVNLSTLTTFQQLLLVIQAIFGSLIFVSLVMVYVRMHHFREKFRDVIEEERIRNGRGQEFRLGEMLNMVPEALHMVPEALQKGTQALKDLPQALVDGSHALMDMPYALRDASAEPLNRIRRKLTRTTNMTVDDPPPTTPNRSNTAPTPVKRRRNTIWFGADTAKHEEEEEEKPTVSKPVKSSKRSSRLDATPEEEEEQLLDSPAGRRSPSEGKSSDDETTLNGDGDNSKKSSVDGDSKPSSRAGSKSDSRPRPEPISIVDPSIDVGAAVKSPGILQDPTSPGFARTPRSRIAFQENRPKRGYTISAAGHVTFSPSTSVPLRNPLLSGTSATRSHGLRPKPARKDSRMTNYGGFPTPMRLVTDLVERKFPETHGKLAGAVRQPTNNIISGEVKEGEPGHVPYITFSAIVGRNSNFKDLTSEQRNELGGVEYRALKVLFVIVFAFWLLVPLLGVTIIAPLMTANSRWDHVFAAQPKLVDKVWFSFTQAFSAFTNLGLSLVDASAVPFQKAYVMNGVVAVLILFGNTCFPILIRFIIWVAYKSVPKRSHYRESFKFLLDHPRRCFVYLFPSTTTWFLLWVVLILTSVDFAAFMALNVGMPVIDAIELPTRVAAGFFQSVAVRAAGFTIVPMGEIAPALKVVYLVMMYISVYPIAMSVRSTNVYEERSLGLYEDDEDDDDDDEAALTAQRGATAVAKYLGWHARRQLAFDMWWMAGCLLLVCIVERSKLNDKEQHAYFNLFNIIFELVSAYGTIGLSLGLPHDNYSLAGDMSPLSKLILCFVMIRGRHRGLPVAIDRAVMLPHDFTASDEAALEERLRRSRGRSRQFMSIDERLNRNCTQITTEKEPILSRTAFAEGFTSSPVAFTQSPVGFTQSPAAMTAHASTASLRSVSPEVPDKRPPAGPGSPVRRDGASMV